ncbi:DUF6112 family protein [Miniimonas arenae]|uniref:DUF6112 family protein n=1 Tax=Miniimonas arenae TaxID=676201 RepID=UPI001FE8D928|nr:DUF6112 family protein [Miniimonas arenae]
MAMILGSSRFPSTRCRIQRVQDPGSGPICWAFGASHGNPALASKGRVGVLVGIGAAALAGAGVAWVNWLIALGNQL